MSHAVLLPRNSTTTTVDELFTTWKEAPIAEKALLVIACAVVIFSIIAFVIAIPCQIMSFDTSIYIQDVYIPALDTAATTPFNASVFVHLEFRRPLAVYNMFYRESELVVFYGHQITPVAGYRVGAFGMGREKRVRMTAAMEAPELPWGEAFRAVSGGSTVELVVEFDERRVFGDADLSNNYSSSRRFDGHYALTAHVAVDASGHMVSEGPIILY